MSKKLVKVNQNSLIPYDDKSLIDILSSANLPQEFKVIGEKQLQVIAEGMPEVYRAKEVYGRKNSQVMGKLMTLTMLRHGPFNALRQCDSQIDHKREALKENGFRLLKTRNEIEQMEEQLQDENLDKYKHRELELDLAKKRMDLADARQALEHALREIYMYMETKKEIKKANNIPDNWDERDFITAEIKENIQTAFQHSYRDVLMTGRLNVGTMEWLEQFGIEPAVAFVEVQEYMKSITDKHDVNKLYEWYDKMYEKYKGEVEKAMARLGVKDLMTEGCSYMEDKEHV